MKGYNLEFGQLCLITIDQTGSMCAEINYQQRIKLFSLTHLVLEVMGR
jgi:hypothetical protein